MPFPPSALLQLLLVCAASAAAPASQCAPEAGEPLLASALSGGRAVFFVHAVALSEGGRALGDVALCAVEAALRAIPARPVIVYVAGLDCGTIPAGLSALLGAWPGVLWVLPLDVAAVLAPFPALAAWYARGAWASGGAGGGAATRGAHLSDALRLALLHTHGGVYLDTDEVLLRSGALEALGERGVGLESPWVFASAVLAFPPRDPLVAAAIAEFAASFDASFWGFNGPRLITRVWVAAPPAAADNLTILSPADLYPLVFADAAALFAPPAAATASVVCRAQALHLWAHATAPALAAAAAACNRAEEFAGSLLGRVMAGSCPATYGTIRGRCGTASTVTLSDDSFGELVCPADAGLPASSLVTLPDGVFTYAASPSAVAAGGDGFTLVVWLRVGDDVHAGGGAGFPFGLSVGLACEPLERGGACAVTVSAAGRPLLRAATPLVPNRWHFVAVVVQPLAAGDDTGAGSDSVYITLSIDGLRQLQASTAVTSGVEVMDNKAAGAVIDARLASRIDVAALRSAALIAGVAAAPVALPLSELCAAMNAQRGVYMAAVPRTPAPAPQPAALAPRAAAAAAVNSAATIVGLVHPDWTGVRVAHYRVPVFAGGAAATVETRELLDTAATAALIARLAALPSLRVVVVNGVLEGTADFAARLRAARPDVDVAVVIHSSPSSPYHHIEAPHIDAVLRAAQHGGPGGAPAVARLGFVKAGMASIFRGLGACAYDVSNLPPHAPAAAIAPLSAADGATHILIPGVGAAKNIAAQTLAACGLHGVVVHVVEPAAVPYLASCPAPVVVHGIQAPADFAALLASVDVVMYVSLSECSPGVVLEAMAAGVPCLTSATSTVYAADKSLEQLLVVDRADDPAAIRSALERIVSELRGSGEADARSRLAASLRALASANAASSAASWSAFIDGTDVSASCPTRVPVTLAGTAPPQPQPSRPLRFAQPRQLQQQRGLSVCPAFTTASCSSFQSCSTCIAQYTSAYGGFACYWSGSSCSELMNDPASSWKAFFTGNGSTMDASAICSTPYNGNAAVFASAVAGTCSDKTTQSTCVAAYPDTYACYWTPPSGSLAGFCTRLNIDAGVPANTSMFFNSGCAPGVSTVTIAVSGASCATASNSSVLTALLDSFSAELRLIPTLPSSWVSISSQCGVGIVSFAFFIVLPGNASDVQVAKGASAISSASTTSLAYATSLVSAIISGANVTKLVAAVSGIPCGTSLGLPSCSSLFPSSSTSVSDISSYSYSYSYSPATTPPSDTSYSYSYSFTPAETPPSDTSYSYSYTPATPPSDTSYSYSYAPFQYESASQSPSLSTSRSPSPTTGLSVTPTPSPFFCSPGYVRTLAGGYGSTVAGADNDVGTFATFRYPFGVALDNARNVYVADTNNHLIRTIHETRAVATLAGGNGSTMSGNVNGVGTFAAFFYPYGVAVDAAGSSVFVADGGNRLIRVISINRAVVKTLAGGGTSSYFSNGFGTSASFQSPISIAADAFGNLFVTDFGCIRQVVIVSTYTTTLAGKCGSYESGLTNGVGLAATFSFPYGVAADGAGNVFVADTGNNAIRRIVVSTGVVTTLAGGGEVGNISGYADGAFSSALFFQPFSIAVDAAGNFVYIAEYNGNYGAQVGGRVRAISMAEGTVSTLAGNGTVGYTDGPGTVAQFAGFGGLAVGGSAGLIFFGDFYNNIIRTICPKNPPSPSRSSSPSASASPSPSPSVSVSLSPSPSSTAVGALFRTLPRTDVVGTLVGAGFNADSEAACRLACVAAFAGGCDAYAFSAGVFLAFSQPWAGSGGEPAPCFLLTNVTALVPSNMMVSDAGVRAATITNLSVAILRLSPSLSPSPAPSASASASASTSASFSTSISGTTSASFSPVVSASPRASAPVSASASISFSTSVGGSASMSISPAVSTSMSVLPTVSASMSAAPTVSASASLVRTVTISGSPSQSVSGTPSALPTTTESPTVSVSVSVTSLLSLSTSVSAMPSASASASASLSAKSTSVSSSASMSRSPAFSASVTAVPSISASMSAAPTVSVSASLVPSVSASMTASPTVSASASLVSTIAVSASPSHSVSGMPSVSPTTTESLSVSVTVSVTSRLSLSASVSTMPSASASASASLSAISSSSVSSTLSMSRSPAFSSSVSALPSVSATMSAVPTVSASASPASTVTLSGSLSRFGTGTLSLSPTTTASPTISVSASVTVSPSLSASTSATPSASVSFSASLPASSSTSASGKASVTMAPSVSASATVEPTVSASASLAPTFTASRSSSRSGTASSTVSPRSTASPSFSGTTSPSPTASPSATAVAVITLTLTVSVPAAAAGTAASDAVISALIADLAARLGVPASWISVVVQASRRALAARQLDASTLVTWLATVRPPPAADAATTASVASMTAAVASIAAAPAASFGASLANTFQTMATTTGVSTAGFTVSNLGITSGVAATPAASPSGATPGASSASPAAAIGGAVAAIIVVAAAVAAAVVIVRRRRVAAVALEAPRDEPADNGGGGGGNLDAGTADAAVPLPPLQPPTTPTLTAAADAAVAIAPLDAPSGADPLPSLHPVIDAAAASAATVEVVAESGATAVGSDPALDSTQAPTFSVMGAAATSSIAAVSGALFSKAPAEAAPAAVADSEAAEDAVGRSALTGTISGAGATSSTTPAAASAPLIDAAARP